MVGEKTAVATLQNGWGNGDVLAARFGGEHTVVGVTYNSGTGRGIGKAAHTGIGPTYIGPYDGAATEHAQPLGAALGDAGFEVSVIADARTEVWKKLVLNCATLPTAALTRLPSGALGHSNVLEVAHALAREATQVARALGYTIDAEERVATITANLQNGGSGKASMLQDVEAGRRTEIDIISGAVSAAAAEHNLDVPLTKTMVTLVRGLEEGAGRHEHATHLLGRGRLRDLDPDPPLPHRSVPDGESCGASRAWRREDAGRNSGHACCAGSSRRHSGVSCLHRRSRARRLDLPLRRHRRLRHEAARRALPTDGGASRLHSAA